MATTQTESATAAPRSVSPPPSKLHPGQCLDAEQVFKHVVISLRADQTITGVREDVACWTAIQHDLGRRVRRGDEVTIVSADGLQVADRCRVLRAEGGKLWLGKPLRVVSLEPVGLYDNGQHRVVPNGTGFSIQNCRDNRAEDRVYQSEEQAKSEILRRMPTRVA